MARLTVSDIVTRVQMKVTDSRIDGPFILSIVNQCNVDIASVIDVKELATTDDVTFLSGQNEISLPSNFHKKLIFAKNTTTNYNLTVKDDRRLVDRQMEKIDRTGNVIIICNDFPNIYYQYDPPSDQDGKIYYHKLPTDLELADGFPAYIPSGLVFRLYYNYVLSQVYDIGEDGLEGEKINTLYHDSQYNKALGDLKLFIGPDPDLPDNLNKNNHFFDFNDY